MEPGQAKAYVDSLYRRVGDRWREQVSEHEFMRALKAGSLPRDTFKLFFRNFGAFTIEINTLTACSYQRFLHFFTAQPDLMASLGDAIADEFVHPQPPGHALVMLQTAAALGLTRDEVCGQPMLPAFRGKIDFARAILYEGTAAEWFALKSTEEMVGHWAGECYTALTQHYGFTPEQAIYFSKHEEADLREHDDGSIGHGQLNRAVLQRLLQTGQGWERRNYGMEYCAVTFVDLHGQMMRAVLDAVGERR